jgi:2-haloacid dehalogenase
MAGRWATFDCYGTLIDWNRGIADAMERLWPGVDRERVLAVYHTIEPVIQEGRSLSYRDVLTRALAAVATIEGHPLQVHDAGTLADSLPAWPPFPEVPETLRELHRRGWNLAVLSNTDPDLLDASIHRIGVPFDLTVTVREAGSYKPAPGHWTWFQDQAAPDVHVHVAASLFHDIRPARELGIPAVWINRLGETSDIPRAAELPDLSRLPEVLGRLSRSGS